MIKEGECFQPWVKSVFEVPTEWYNDLFLPGQSRANRRAVGPPVWGVLVLKVSFKPQDLTKTQWLKA